MVPVSIVARPAATSASKSRCGRPLWGPCYRVYFGQDGDSLIFLLCGGTKRRQQDDIAEAQAHWAEYKRRKKDEG